MSKLFWKIYGHIIISPIRYLFGKMLCNCYLRLKFEKRFFDDGYLWPNIHWWILYKTVFKFFKWLYWDGWRYFCKWGDGRRQSYPFFARILHKIGQTTAGFAIGGGECPHCAHDIGCQTELSYDETGKTYRLIKTWTVSTPDGTDYCSLGVTTCPVCGFEAEYEDSSL